ncbi:MAG TPA: hypothetical protein VGB18_06365, partial [Candidatus Thermoplasmatota archaeon]
LACLPRGPRIRLERRLQSRPLPVRHEGRGCTVLLARLDPERVHPDAREPEPALNAGFDGANLLHGVIKKLRGAGHKIAITEPKYPAFHDLLKQQNPGPEVFVVDCSKLASHARESCNYVRSLKSYKETPILLYNVKKEDEAKAREKVPNAVVLFDDRVERQLESMGYVPTKSA